MADGMSEFETIHRARHVNIREHHPDVAAALQYPYSLIGACSFYDLKARIFDDSYGAHANQRFIFDNENRRYFQPVSPQHLLSPRYSLRRLNSKLPRGGIVP